VDRVAVKAEVTVEQSRDVVIGEREVVDPLLVEVGPS